MMYKLFFKRNIKTFIIWCLLLGFFLVASMTKYEAFAKDPIQASQLLDSLPNVVKVIYGMGNVDITVLGGYYSVVVLYFQIMLAMYSAILGAKLIYEEEDLKTSEFLFVKPISRTKILMKKFLSAFILISCLNLAVLIFSYVYLNEMYGHVDNFLQLNFTQYIICVFTLAIGTLLGTSKYNNRGILLSGFTVMVFFVIRSIALINEWNLSLFSPFYAFETAQVYTSSINYLYVLYYITFSGVLFLLAVLLLNKRDIKN